MFPKEKRSQPDLLLTPLDLLEIINITEHIKQSPLTLMKVNDKERAVKNNDGVAGAYPI